MIVSVDTRRIAATSEEVKYSVVNNIDCFQYKLKGRRFAGSGGVGLNPGSPSGEDRC
jgi:hypothetical protein